MTRISLESFIRKTKGKKVATPWGTQKGQCVSLIQVYIKDCLGQPAKARGNAKNWVKTYVKEGLGTIVSIPRKGDILVFTNGNYGHIAIYIDKNTQYDQNNGSHDNRSAGYAKLQKGYTILRPKTSLIEDKKEVVKTTTNKTYKVVKGDSLSKICTKFYGKYTNALVDKIVHVNKRKYPNIARNFICVGWILTIPNL